MLCGTDDIYSRYVQNNFKDVERQAAIDMCLGKDAQQGTSSLCEMAWQQQQLEVCQAFPSVRQLRHRIAVAIVQCCEDLHESRPCGYVSSAAYAVL